ncbi:MAG: hypothetical protein OQJ97_15330 [Rhodospirillales bacterium]|nr:hypothetical protein [Rhodospirillales bacterium]
MAESVATETTEASASFKAFQEKVRGTNIDEQTLLATDYLNHFNEIVMLIDMLPMMPDCLEDALEWKPKSYQEHFQDSTFSDKELAVEAYDHVPETFKLAFEGVVENLNALILKTLDRVSQMIATEELERMSVMVPEYTRKIQRLQDAADGIIHGGTQTMEQDEIDALLDDGIEPEAEPASGGQADIDALFD